MAFQIEPLNPWSAPAFGALATAVFKPWLEMVGPGGKIVAAGATSQSRPVALALARACDEGFVLDWVAVAPLHRGRGIGRAILNVLEAEIRERSASAIHAAFSSSLADAPRIRHLLESTGWCAATPRIQMTVCVGSLLEDRWARPPAGLAADCAVFPWIGSPSESSNWDFPWVPQHLAPPRHAEKLDALTSLGLSRHGSTLGWLLTSRVGPETLCCESLFVHPDLRRLGGARMLISEVLRRQAAHLGNSSHLMFTASTRNEPMMRLTSRHFRRHSVSETEVLVFSKALRAIPGGPSQNDNFRQEATEKFTSSAVSERRMGSENSYGIGVGTGSNISSSI